jgi:hypothetical protein
MPLLRASIVVAVIFAFSPVRDAGPQPVREEPAREETAREEPAGAPTRTGEPTIESLIRGSTEPDGRAALGYEDALAMHDAWRALPEDAQEALARLVADELRSGIYAPNR